MYYMDVNLYHYFIGREDQSVNEKVMIGRIDQAIRVHELMLSSVRLMDIPDPHKRRYMMQYLEIITTVCSVLLIVDAGLTLASLDCWFMRESGTMDYENASAIVQFCNENYDNDFMTNRFQSMTMNPEDASRAK